MRPGRVPLGFALPPVLLAAVVFFPITRSYFYADDFLHLYEVANGRALAFILQPTAGHLLLVRNFLFCLGIWIFGPEPAGFFWLTLVTHLLNVTLLFLILRRALASDRLACAGASLWGVSPFNAGTLGWYSVYGQTAATTFVLLAVWDCARQATPPGAVRVASWALLMALAANCFGTAVGVAAAFPLVAALLCPQAYRRWTTGLLLGAIPVAVGAMYLGQHELYRRLHPESFIGFGSSVPFMVALAREGGWWPLAGMVLHLLIAGLSNVCFSFAFRPDTYPATISYVLAAGVAAGTVGALVRGPAERRRHVLAFLLVALAAYGMIGLGRGNFLSRNMGLARAAVVSRYHYLATAAVTMLLGTVLAFLSDPFAGHRRIKNTLLGVLLGGLLLLHHRSDFRIDQHDSARNEVRDLLAMIHARAAATPPEQPVYIPNLQFRSVGPLVNARWFPGQAAAFIAFVPTNAVDGRPIRFVTHNENGLMARFDGGRAAEVVVGPEAVAPVP